MELISDSISRYREMNIIFRYLETISRYQEMISRYPEISRITDIVKSGSGVELPHLAFTTDDDEVATVIPPRLKSFRPKSHPPQCSTHLINFC